MNAKANYKFIEFVRPDGFHQYSIEQQFGVFLWMCQTAYRYADFPDDHLYLQSGPIELLSKKSSCINIRAVYPITSIADLNSRFHYALLARFASKHAQMWRDQNGIAITGNRVIAFPHHAPFKGPKCDADVQKQVCDLLAAKGKLSAQLNSCHRAAKNIDSVVIHCDRKGFRFTLNYGYDGSVWHHDLARTENKEPFTATLDRATAQLAQMKTEQRRAA